MLKGLKVAYQSESYTTTRVQKSAASRTGKPRPHIRGQNSPLWKGTKTQRRTDMERVEYKVWRATVFKRDSHTCIMCRTKSKRIEAHHIVEWASSESLRYDVNNGVTLCSECHRLVQGKEQEFAERFLMYVQQAVPVVLTEDEIERLRPIFVHCSDCGAALSRPPHHRSKKWFFCDITCKRNFEQKIGTNWRTGV